MGLLLISIVFIVFLFLYYQWNHTYWKRRGIPSPKGRLFIGHFHEVSDLFNPRGFVLKKWTEELGKVYGYYEGLNKVLVTSDLEMMKEIFVKQFDCFYARKSTNLIHGDLEDPRQEPAINLFSSRGARWKRLRALASPAFSIKALKQVHDTVEDSVKVMIDHMEKQVDQGPFNIHLHFQEFTYDVISRLAMGQPQSDQFRNPYVQITQNIFLKSQRVLPWYLVTLFPMFEYRLKQIFYDHPNVRGGDVGLLLKFCEQAVLKRIEERAENEKLGYENSSNDFIDMFLEHHSEVVEDKKYGEAAIEKKATTKDAVGSCFVFLLAGFDTTANTLGYSAYLLAKNPHVMRKLQKEIDDLCSQDNVSYDDLSKLTYLDAVIRETLRLYPVAPFACSRECVKTTTVCGIKIEKNTKVEADVLSVHVSKEIWGDNANEFVPERWINASPRHLMSWIPFGAGPRQCVGMRLGLTESKLALVHVLKRFDLETGPATEKELKIVGCTTTSPESVTLYLKSRIV